MVDTDIKLIEAMELLLQLQKTIAEVDRSKHALYMQRFDVLEIKLDKLLKHQELLNKMSEPF